MLTLTLTGCVEAEEQAPAQVTTKGWEVETMVTVCYRMTTLMVDTLYEVNTGEGYGNGAGTTYGDAEGSGGGLGYWHGHGDGKGYNYSPGYSDRDLDGEGGCQIIY